MKAFICDSCGSNDFHEENGYRVCNHCGTRHAITRDDMVFASSTVELQDDVSRLMAKCRTEPERAKKYAQRILEIDPYNEEATRILYSSLSKEYGQSSKSSGCYIATAVYGSYDCPQVWTLRRYRDDMLSNTWYGRAFIRVYYATSPTLVKWFGDSAWFINLWKPKLDRMVRALNEIGVLDTPYMDRGG